MKVKDLENYIVSLINATRDEISTYSNNIQVKLDFNEKKLMVAFNSPTSFTLDSDLYYKIFDVLNIPLFPFLTLIPSEKVEVEEFPNAYIESRRCFVYYFRVGVPKRNVFLNFRDFENSIKFKKWEIMKGLFIDIDNLTSIAISSSSGGGKSYLINQFLFYFYKIGCDLIIIDGKKDLPAKFAIKNGCKLITNSANKSDDNILSDICDQLSSVNKIIHDRQNLLFENKITEKDLKPIIIVFDEIGALTTLASKNIKDNFFKLLTRVATLGRQSKVHLLLSSQRLDANTLPTIVKEQCNILIQLGSLTSNNLQYLFPDYKNINMLVPADEIGRKGRGIISINNNLYTFLVPTVKEVV